jgi:pilus assembly protein CpaE
MPEPTRVLIVSVDADVLDTMRRAFVAPEFAVAGEAWPGIDAVRRATEDAPHVVVVHVEPPLGPAARNVQALAAAAPGAGIAVVSSHGDLETIRRLMNAGADDFTTLPLPDEALRETARRALTASKRRAGEVEPSDRVAGRVITVAGPRGGVGKTTVATNLAVALAQDTTVSVAVVDLDLLFGGAAIALDLMPDQTVQEWLQARASGDAAPAGRYLATHRTGVKLLAAPAEPDPGAEFGPPETAALIEDLASAHDFVIVDTPASFTPVTAAAVELASVVLLLTTPDVASLRAVRYVVQTLRGWGVDDDRLRLVRNLPLPLRSDRDAEVASTVGIPVAWSLPHDRAVLRASDTGAPVCESSPRSGFAREVRAIAHYFGHGEPVRRRRRLKVI